MKKDVAIIGAGPVGIFSVFQAGMLGMSSVVIDSLEVIGGQCSALYPEKPIYDIPGYPSISAQLLINNLTKQAEPFNPEYLLNRQVNSLVQESNRFILNTSSGDVIESKIVLIAAGAGCFGPNRPPLENITAYEGKSVFYMVKKREAMAGKKIVVAGGGDSALDWAISLSDIADVTIVHRRKKFRAAPASIGKIQELEVAGKIKLVTDYQLDSLQGEGGNLSAVIVRDLDGKLREIEAEILLPFFGLSQDLGPILKFGLDTQNNYIKVSQPSYESSINGIYAVGDVAKYPGKLKLILTGFAEVSSALHHSYSRVFEGKALHFEYSTSKGVGSDSEVI